VPTPDVPPPPSGRGVPVPRLGDALLGLLAFLGAQLVVGGAGVAVLAVLGIEPAGAALLAVVVAAQLASGLAIVAVVALGRRPLRILLGEVAPRLEQVGHGLAVGLVGLVGAYGINALLLRLSGSAEPVEQLVLEELASGALAVALGALAAVVLAPITEEVLFRVLLLGALRHRVGDVPALVGSTLAFTIAHAEVATSQPLALVGLGALGLLLGISYLRSRSVVVPVVAHATFNAASLTFALVASRLGLG
jgi:membrane protease YdiL (CAAX protease family)